MMRSVEYQMNQRPIGRWMSEKDNYAKDFDHEKPTLLEGNL
jgi:hypothetical protein